MTKLKLSAIPDDKPVKSPSSFRRGVSGFTDLQPDFSPRRRGSLAARSGRTRRI